MGEPTHKLAFFYKDRKPRDGTYSRTNRSARTLCPDELGQVNDLIGIEYPYDTNKQKEPKSINWDHVTCELCLSLRNKEEELTNFKKYKVPITSR